MATEQGLQVDNCAASKRHSLDIQRNGASHHSLARKKKIFIDNAIIAFHFITVKDYVAPRRSRTFNLPISASDALALSCRRLLIHGDIFPANCLKRSTPIRQPIVYVHK